VSFLDGALAVFRDAKARFTDPHHAPLGIMDGVQGLINEYRGNSAAIKAGITATILGSVAGAAALSMVPLESNFGSVYAGTILAKLAEPGVKVAINGPIEEALSRYFPTNHLNARHLLTGIEEGIFSFDDLNKWAFDTGLMDPDWRLLIKLAAVKRFNRVTDSMYAVLETAHKDLLNFQMDSMRIDIDQQVADLKATLAEAKKYLKADAAT
jgi:hypothetical protein